MKHKKPDLETLRHSCAHIMAQAVKELWPETKVAIGPAIEGGFYYDFDRPQPFTPEDLKKIEKVMRRIVNDKLPLKRSMMEKEMALQLFSEADEPYKVELIQDIPDKEVSIYSTSDQWLDLCKGPHVENTGEIKAFKLLSVAGAYWRGDEHKARLQRIYGTCFFNEENLQKHLMLLEEAKKRDHRILGPQLELFNIYHEDAGAGLVFYHPKGAMLRKVIEDYVRDQHGKRGYEFIMTPNILKGRLWDTSGHSQYYRDLMYYFGVDKEEFAVKPMNCPGHMLIYKSKLRSYRDMPIRWFELGTVCRREKAGVLHGLLRVRGFTQDDAHIFCRPDQLREEVMGVIDFVFDTLHDFGFKDIEIELSTRPEEFIGKPEDWDLATQALEDSLKAKKLNYKVQEGEGAFYGPKIDFKLKDALGRLWQCSTIQCDFALPERFELEYTDKSGKALRPIMLHRAILGSVERFIGTLIEHYAGAFPVWLAPVQAEVIPVKPEHNTYAQNVAGSLRDAGIRVDIDSRGETLNKRIREGTLKKIPYLLVVGAKEVPNKSVSVRKYAVGDQGAVKLDKFLAQIQDDIAKKRP